MKTRISREQLAEIIGDIDDFFAARIIATAADQTVVERAFHDVQRAQSGDLAILPEPTSPAYTRVRALLEELIAEEEDLSYTDYATD